MLLHPIFSSNWKPQVKVEILNEQLMSVTGRQELDEDGSGSVSYPELCSQMRRLELDPPIHLTQSDFDVITQACPREGKGALNLEGF
jgi:hypothetical protein